MMKWIHLVHEISQIPMSVANEEYDELVMEVELDPKEGWIDIKCRQTTGTEVEDLSLFDIDDPDLMELSFDLHKAMKDHTGGDLKRYTIRIDESGKAKANFEYHDPQPENVN